MIDGKDVDWTGVAPRSTPIAPLTPATFVERLRALSAAVDGLARLSRAFGDQSTVDGDRLPRTPREPR